MLTPLDKLPPNEQEKFFDWYFYFDLDTRKDALSRKEEYIYQAKKITKEKGLSAYYEWIEAEENEYRQKWLKKAEEENFGMDIELDEETKEYLREKVIKKLKENFGEAKFDANLEAIFTDEEAGKKLGDAVRRGLQKAEERIRKMEEEREKRKTWFDKLLEKLGVKINYDRCIKIPTDEDIERQVEEEIEEELRLARLEAKKLEKLKEEEKRKKENLPPLLRFFQDDDDFSP